MSNANISTMSPIFPNNKVTKSQISTKYPNVYTLLQKLNQGQLTDKEIATMEQELQTLPLTPPKAQKESESKLMENNFNRGFHFTQDVARVTNVMNKAFQNDHANDYIMKKLYNIPINQNCSKYRVESTMHLLSSHYFDNGAEVVQANNFNAVAIWTKPGQGVDIPLTNDSEFNRQYMLENDEAKHIIIPEGMEYYYLFTIARDPEDSSVKGSVRAIFDHYKARADEENCCIILEAINEKARDVYKYFGFKVCRTFHYGVGEVNSLGQYDPEGTGFTAFLMVYHKNPDILKCVD